jgi:hypothetical protein
MKGQRGGWRRSNSFIEKNAPALSDELRDLLDCIFEPDEDARITIQVGGRDWGACVVWVLRRRIG